MQDRTCSVAGCDRPARARGWCPLHWQRWSNTGDPLGLRPRVMKPRSWRVASCADCQDWIATKGFGGAAKKRCDTCQRTFERLMAPTHKVAENPTPCVVCGEKIGKKGGRGLCAPCLQRSKRLALKAAGGKPCAVEGCVNRGFMPGSPYCDMHRSRLRATGELGPVGPKINRRVKTNPLHIPQKHYGMWRDRLLAEQGGVCKYCRRADGYWHLDHDQDCCGPDMMCQLCVRATLCAGCNTAIGALHHDPQLLRFIADDLEQHKARSQLRLIA